MSGAHLSDPEVVRHFRRRMAIFLQTCSAALGGSAGDFVRVQDWLHSEQQSYWKKQIARREEVYQAARRTWLDAEAEVRASHNSRGIDKQSSMEERVLMDRARRSREEAEEKLAVVRRWLIRLQQECGPLIHLCRDHDLALHEQGARALSRLDQIAERVEAYLDVPRSVLPASPACVASAPAADGGAACLP